MALKTAHVSDVPNLDQVPENAASVLYSCMSPKGIDTFPTTSKSTKFQVIGHRGSGMNMLSTIKENTILSFNNAAKFPVDFVELDVQVTKDNHPIIFHDNFIYTEEDNGTVSEKRATELTLAEFLCYGPQKVIENMGKSLLRKAKDGSIYNWKVEDDEPSCTLQQAFENVDASLGFNIELKFDDDIVYQDNEIVETLQVILGVVYMYAKDRPILFSTFQPDAARLMRKLQASYPVYFLTDGGSEVYTDVRRNSLEEAIKLCLENKLQGIVSEARAVFRNPQALTRIKELDLSFMTYGELNNTGDAVYMQHLMGVDGVIVDLVPQITQAVSDFIKENRNEGEEQMLVRRPEFWQHEVSFLLNFIPELIQRERASCSLQ